MGAFDFLFKGLWKKREINGYFKLLDGYTPVFSTFTGGVYERELTRSCIHAFARHASKLQPGVEGADLRGIRAVLSSKPNPFMTSAQYLYKCATIYSAQNTLFILPLLDKYDRATGYYPVSADQVEVLDVSGKPFLRFTFGSGEKIAVELDRCGVVSKYLYKNDIRGESNDILAPTMQLLEMQDRGIAEGIKNSASFRFMATLNQLVKSDDLKKQRKDFVENNFSEDAGGLALFPQSYTNVRQIVSSPRVVDPEQMKLIQDRVFTYFGTNEKILHNQASGDDWAAYYEGEIEPFAIQLSQAMTCMTYSEMERARGNAIIWTANRLQYMTNSDKLQVSSQMFDRGIMTTNDVMDIWGLPHVPDGDKRYIRKEYAEISTLGQDASGSAASPGAAEMDGGLDNGV